MVEASSQKNVYPKSLEQQKNYQFPAAVLAVSKGLSQNSYLRFRKSGSQSQIASCYTKNRKIVSLKGQLISKCLLGDIVSTKKTKEFFLRISALASKMRLNQKLYNTKYVKQPLISIIKCLYFFDLTSF